MKVRDTKENVISANKVVYLLMFVYICLMSRKTTVVKLRLVNKLSTSQTNKKDKNRQK